MPRATKKSIAPEPTTGEYSVQVIAEDILRVDFYGLCVPRATGEPGWACATFTYEQALGLSRVLANSALLVKPGTAPAKKTRKK